VEGAAAALAVLERRLEKTVLRAPADGVVSVIIAEVGENLTAGQPLAFAATGKQWLSFNAREDLLHDFTVGAKVDVARPGAHASTPAIHGTRPARALRDLARRARSAITTTIRCACASICSAMRPRSSPA
jgi:multidrug resistance efflux pump